MQLLPEQLNLGDVDGRLLHSAVRITPDVGDLLVELVWLRNRPNVMLRVSNIPLDNTILELKKGWTIEPIAKLLMGYCKNLLLR